MCEDKCYKRKSSSIPGELTFLSRLTNPQTSAQTPHSKAMTISTSVPSSSLSAWLCWLLWTMIVSRSLRRSTSTELFKSQRLDMLASLSHDCIQESAEEYTSVKDSPQTHLGASSILSIMRKTDCCTKWVALAMNERGVIDYAMSARGRLVNTNYGPCLCGFLVQLEITFRTSGTNHTQCAHESFLPHFTKQLTLPR
ncbi:hypothetical protein J6590_076911 [Homalodisca vitripennis]|nr:hypothetical protein J6590_076911 [Homalodisca vitripennis]